MLPVVREYIINRERHRLNLRLHRERVFLRRRQDPFLLPDIRFIELFRLNKALVRNLIEMLRPYVDDRRRMFGISLKQMVLCALRFYATGSYQRSMGEEYNFGMAQSTTHKCIHKITTAINDHVVRHKIRFPSAEERNRIKAIFLNKYRFPGVVGLVDGTHIAILKPTVDEQNFINRKGFHSLNCQIICDDKLKIRSIFANYGGSTHDSFIWRNSQVNDYLRTLYNNNERCWVLGDSGYPLLPYLMTPFQNPENEGQERYNRAHISARNCVERCIGILKMRFRCILRERTARYNPRFVCKLVNVCGALHNMCIEEGMDNNFEVAPDDFAIHHAGNNHEEGINMRTNIVENYFNFAV